MADILIRGVPDDVVEALDAHAQRVGLSRSEYLRRLLTTQRPVDQRSLTVADLARSAQAFADLDDPEVMRRAWE
ncbi:FitA-like ribbon-helix-helix domain-containing protein [Mycobacterium talmoniae]|uniref:Antitoxin n=1 Tax=Mycobacterium talmoniae TaxID=1858794 RepID=A0A1S1NEZ3_9MYCO|nr:MULTISPECIES: ribbon-helix-helix protein, CopG family [Mycobacterium]OHU99102.1 antitoxin [Mycobacterium talmoniae]PQM46954.1 Antitoxin VapB2 [Mycobacterium talmoniae]TDH48375.1 ribbon-helix-helix protein, CopG family [Mycobacterium eburneum]